MARPGVGPRANLEGYQRPPQEESSAGKGVSDQVEGRQPGGGRADRAGVRAEGAGYRGGDAVVPVYRDPANPDYLLFVEHFANQAAYDAHTGSAAYKELIAGRFADLIVEFVEIDHQLLVSL